VVSVGRNDKMIEAESETDYMAISYYIDLKERLAISDMKDEKVELPSMLMLIRAFRRSSATSEN
jgi:hypothetical protein